MKKNNLIKISILALFAVVVLAAFNVSKKEEIKAEPKKCCMKECTPQPKDCNTEYFFYESVSGHPIAAISKH